MRISENPCRGKHENYEILPNFADEKSISVPVVFFTTQNAQTQFKRRTLHVPNLQQATVNEQILFFYLICIRFGICEVRRLKNALFSLVFALELNKQILQYLICIRTPLLSSFFNFFQSRFQMVSVFILYLQSILQSPPMQL